MMEPAGSPSPPARAQSLTIDSRTRRELALFGAALAAGLFVVPVLIWLAGHHSLGPYTHGDNPQGLGPVALYADYFAGLAHGWLGYWTVALGPAVLLMAARLWLRMLRRLPRD